MKLNGLFFPTDNDFYQCNSFINCVMRRLISIVIKAKIIALLKLFEDIDIYI